MKQKIPLLILFLILVCISLFASEKICMPCGSPGVVYHFNNQSDVNNFISTECTHMLGHVIIYGSNFTDLTPLSSIVEIDGLLSIENNVIIT